LAEWLGVLRDIESTFSQGNAVITDRGHAHSPLLLAFHTQGLCIKELLSQALEFPPSDTWGWGTVLPSGTPVGRTGLHLGTAWL